MIKKFVLAIGILGLVATALQAASSAASVASSDRDAAANVGTNTDGVSRYGQRCRGAGGAGIRHASGFC
jgi:hypothetical protein